MSENKIEIIVDKCISGVVYSLKKMKDADDETYWKGYRDCNLNILESLGVDLSKVVQLMKNKNDEVGVDEDRNFN